MIEGIFIPKSQKKKKIFRVLILYFWMHCFLNFSALKDNSGVGDLHLPN